jgi:hypothetical protein
LVRSSAEHGHEAGNDDQHDHEREKDAHDAPCTHDGFTLLQ